MAKRRKQGEGTLRLRKDGRWEGRVVVGYDDKGLPITKNVTAKTKMECAEKLEKLKSQYGKSTEKINSEMLFGDWIDFWYRTYCKHTIRLTTQIEYENRIYQHIIPEIGIIPLNQLTQSDLQQFYARERSGGRKIRIETYGAGLSDRVIRAIHTNCRSALEKAVQDGLMKINPAIGCKLPPKKSREMKVLTQSEIIRFLNRAKEEDYYELFLLELATGMRRGEILALKWSDLNFKTGELWIERQVNVIHGEIIRACLVSFENNADKSQRNHLERILQKPFTIFPKPATLIEPTKRTFNSPTLWNNRKSVQFIAFFDFNFSVRNSFYFIIKILSCIVSINKNFFISERLSVILQ